jgi:hypothetical protein
MSRTISLVVVTWFIGGCVVEEGDLAPDETVVTQEGLSPQGITFNGINTNEIAENGLSPQGTSVNGISSNGLSPQGTVIGVVLTGTPLTGPQLVGSTWTGHLSDGNNLTIRIDAAQQLTGANSDMWSYRMSGLVNGVAFPLCVDSSGAPTFAVSVAGTWNLSEGTHDGGSYDPLAADFTIACRASSIAKCVEFGYKPWRGAVRQLATCVRALRADYCGDGTPHTVNGTIINIFDDVGIQTDAADWVPEAEWTPEGATCVSKKKNTRFDQVAHDTPVCFPRTLKPEKSCGTGFSEGAAIITELAPR